MFSHYDLSRDNIAVIHRSHEFTMLGGTFHTHLWIAILCALK
jgi:hypothetical protein